MLPARQQKIHTHTQTRLESVGTRQAFTVKYFHYGLAASFHASSCGVHIDMLGLNRLIKENEKGEEKKKAGDRKKGPAVKPDTSTCT